jgi:hypothetical protein
MNPFKYKSTPIDDDDGRTQWEDNWLSNLFAWGSDTFIPSWCGDEKHWTTRFMAWFFTDCPFRANNMVDVHAGKRVMRSVDTPYNYSKSPGMVRKAV